MEENNYKPGGAFQIARQIFDGELWVTKPSSWKVIWIYILGRVNHKKNGVCERGEGFFQWIKEKEMVGVDISQDMIKKASSYFTKNAMISTRRSTRGVYIKVLNYNTYQTMDNYQSTRQSTKKALEKHYDKQECKNDKNVEREAEASPTPKDNSNFFFKGIRDFQKKESTVEATSMAELLKKMSLDQGLESPQRKKAFWEEVVKFGDYWQEKDQLGKKERWQMQRTFEVEKRLQTWLKKAGQWSKPASYINKNTPNFVL